MTAGLIASLVALAAATAFGLYWKSRDGRVVSQGGTAGQSPPAARGTKTAVGQAAGAQAGRGPAAGAPVMAQATETDVPLANATAATGPGGRGGLSPGDLGTPLGSRATLVQFSSAFCAPCRATRRILSDVADMVDGVSHVEIDAESRLDLVRRLDVRRTPTTFVLGPDGIVTHRASGQPRKADVIAALGAVA